MRWARWWRSVRERRAATTVHHMPPLRPLSRSGRVPTLRAAHLAEPRCFSERYVRCGVRGRTREGGSMMGCIPLPMSGKARNADWQTAGQSGLLYPLRGSHGDGSDEAGHDEADGHLRRPVLHLLRRRVHEEDRCGSPVPALLLRSGGLSETLAAAARGCPRAPRPAYKLAKWSCLATSCCRTRRKDGGAGVTHKRKISIVTDRPPVGSRAPPRHSQPAETATHRHSVCPKLCAQPSLTEWCDRQRPAGLL